MKKELVIELKSGKLYTFKKSGLDGVRFITLDSNDKFNRLFKPFANKDQFINGIADVEPKNFTNEMFDLDSWDSLAVFSYKCVTSFGDKSYIKSIKLQ